MQSIVRNIGDFDDLVFSVDLTDYGKSASDVSDIIFSVKLKKTDSDDSLLLKRLSQGNGEISFTGDTILIVNVKWSDVEYDNFSVREYLAGLFIHFNGDPKADEHVDTLFKLVIKQDFLRL